MQQTFQGVAKVLLESSGRFKVHNNIIMFLSTIEVTVRGDSIVQLYNFLSA